MARRLLAVAVVATALAAPALASGSIECETTDGSGIIVIGNLGRAQGAPLDAVIVTVGGTTWSTRDTPPQIRVGAFHQTRQAVHLLLEGPGADRLDLRIRINPDDASTGALVFRGRTHPVSCEFG